MISRNIYVAEHRPTEPIYVVFGNNMQTLRFYVMDVLITSFSNIKAYVEQPDGTRYKCKNVTTTSEYFEIAPPAGFFAVGKNKLQFELPGEMLTVNSFAIDVYCEENLQTDIPLDSSLFEKVEGFIERAEDAAEKAVNVLNSIPEDYMQMRGLINDVSSQKISKPTTSENGKIPRAINNDIEWVDVGQPTDSQVEAVMEDWLDNHPEATTSVQDHSLTLKKFKIGELPFITPQMFGAVANGNTDDSQGIINAINYCNANGINLYIPHGTYVIKNDLPDLVGICLRGDNNGFSHYFGSIILDKRTSEKPLFNFKIKDGDATKIGGGVVDVMLKTYTTKNCIKLNRDVGWDFNISNVAIYGYKGSAIESDGSDANINNVNISDCGTDDYAVKFGSNANAHRVQNLHVEHCLKGLMLNGYGHSFVGCKFEQSKIDKAVTMIKTDGTFATVHDLASFSACLFAGIDIDGYVYKDAAITSYADVPYLISVSCCSFNGCTFLNGVGSGGFTYTQTGETKFINAETRCLIEGCTFINPSYHVAGIRISLSSFINNRVETRTGTPRLISANNPGYVVNCLTTSFIKGNKLYDMSNTLYALSNVYDGGDFSTANDKRYNRKEFYGSGSGELITAVFKPLKNFNNLTGRISINTNGTAIHTMIDFACYNNYEPRVNANGRSAREINLYVKDNALYVQWNGNSDEHYVTIDGIDGMPFAY